MANNGRSVSGTSTAIDDILNKVFANGVDPASQHIGLAMLTGAGLESNMNPSAIQQGGLGRGLFQIDLGAHKDVTQAQALDPQFSVNYMYQHYVDAVNQVNLQYGHNIWNTNPQLAAEKSAYFAERPAKDYYASQGSVRVGQAFQQAQRDVQLGPDIHVPGLGEQITNTIGQTTGTIANAGGAVAGAISNPLDLLNRIGKDISDPSFWIRVGFILLGFIMIVISVKAMAAERPEEEEEEQESPHRAEHITEHMAEMGA